VNSLTFDKVRKPDHLSPSQIEIGKCPYKYYRLRLLRDIPNEGIQLDKGKAIHEIVYRYTDFCIKNKTEGDFEQLQKIVNSVFDEIQLPETEYIEIRETAIKFGENGIQFERILEYERREVINITDPGNEDVYYKCLKCDHSFSQKYDTANKGYMPEGIECPRCGHKEIEQTTILMEIVIDRVNSYRGDNGSVIEFEDFKNQMNILTKKEVNEHEQLNIYKYLGAKYLYPNFDYVRTGIHHLRYSFTRWSDMTKVNDCFIEFENMEKYLQRQWSRLITTNEWSPICGEQCWKYGGCPVLLSDECPMYTKDKVNELKVSENIEDKIRAYKKLNLEASELKTIIYNYFKENQCLKVDNKIVGYQPSFSYKYRLKPFVEYCNEKKIDYSSLTISKTDAEKVIKIKKMNESQAAEVKTLQEETATSTFKGL
jgi:DNA-directed RNA polymerase subunit RPC12/RpoP